ncbi:MAG: hybrid sensor histidine kinase/response regulator [Desulfuromonadales bacterium]|nr:MAG: hybrid sensor histidine kinase/response regulator [Desulfuromonadales bacterium]
MDKDFLKKLLATFTAETKERLDAISAGLVELEQSASPERELELVEALFRETHSLKGAARSVNAAPIESVSHALESVFSALKRQEITPLPELFDLLHTATDTIGELLPSLETGPSTAERERLKELVFRLHQAQRGTLPPLPPKPASRAEQEESAPAGKTAAPRTVRVSAEKLDTLLHQTEGMLTAKLAAAQRMEELRDIRREFALWEKEWKKTLPALRRMRRRLKTEENGKSSSGRSDAPAGRLLDFLDWNYSSIKAVGYRLTRLAKGTEHDLLHLGGMVETLLEDVREALMLPFSSLLALLPKLVRDLSRDRGKEVEMVMEGETIEIDRRVLEEMKDPLVHLVRNCVDHGIERPGERERQGKPPRGRVTVTVALLESNRVEVVIADDGAGIDTARLREAASRLGLVTQEGTKRASDQEILSHIFASGLSTSPIIDDISGRGLGLAIVREKVERLGGSIAVETEAGRGTTFRITLPLTLSTFRGVLVQAAGHLFVVPTADVERVARKGRHAIITLENRETIELDGQTLSYVLLSDALELPRRERADEAGDLLPFFVLATEQGRIAFGVDQIVGEQEVMVKGLGMQLRRVRNIAGATVLGSGKVVPILNCRDLVKSAVRVAATGTAIGYMAPSEESAPRSVLVVEDSITARTLLKNILESAGYRVRTAVDGVDALTLLGIEDFDLVVSDVDMPRMNGFELTGKIRASRQLADLPVVLVTSLDSREDRERGVDAGANAYIVKSSFDQSNLLDALRRLI